ncbi:PREDICTED: uncharacterized protein LOC104804865 [Tarenaya hassleriana]|uniref:uncharacterized protein LOC104804865 n=1 Tax=Tarenaya hassleriana TaxID=28532 RepID=UPI00053C1A4D|nr:PREDICTED: uncharacterized protein LOC104804865 [Tarenaya hassleriana]
MSEFPSDLEGKVASSLLLLSTEPVFSSPSRLGHEKNMVVEGKSHGLDSLSLSCASIGSRSCGSSLSSDGSSQKSSDRDFEINSILVIKPVKKRRSTVIWTAINLKNPVLGLCKQSDDDSKEESCLSSGSSEVSSVESRLKIRDLPTNEKANEEPKNKEICRSSSIRRRADAILEFLSAGCSSEVTIRHVLGDSPDTSKALRMYSLYLSVQRLSVWGFLLSATNAEALVVVS